MSAQHTPATWTPYVCGRSLDEMPEYLRVCIANSGGSEFRMVAGFDERGRVDVVCMVGNGPRGEANARLIAAAPELLEALEELVSHSATQPSTKEGVRRQKTAVTKAIEAIAKAKSSR